MGVRLSNIALLLAAVLAVGCDRAAGKSEGGTIPPGEGRQGAALPLPPVVGATDPEQIGRAHR